MKIYQASAFDRAHEMNENAAKLKAAGHDVVSRWHSGSQIDLPDLQQNVERLSPDNAYTVEWAHKNFNDINDADALLFYSSAESEFKGRGGRHTEFGYAFAKNKIIIFIGRREVIFHALIPNHMQFMDIDEFIAYDNGDNGNYASIDGQ